MLTIVQIVNLMKAGLGKTPTSAHDLYQTLNRAGRHLYNFVGADGNPANWSWRLRNTTLTTTAGNELVALPSDFEALESITSGNLPVRMVDLSEIHAARSAAIAFSASTLLCIPPTHTFHATTGALTQRSAIIYPIPTVGGSPALDLWYRAGWSDVSSANDNHYPRIPPEFEEALICLARDGAIAFENQSLSLEGSRGNAMLEQLRIIDAQRQQNLGPMRGGASDRRTRARSDPMYAPSLTV